VAGVPLPTAPPTGDIVAAHRPMLDVAPFCPVNLDRWIELFDETIDELFTGPVAEHAKRRARQIAAALAHLGDHHHRTSPTVTNAASSPLQA
jgi:truncated hemoglobin YjbI